MLSDNATLEEQREKALQHYKEASDAISHWSSFVENAIKNYTPASDIIKTELAYYCEECKQICSPYEQGLSCECGQGKWENERYYAKDYPKKWKKVTLIILRVRKKSRRRK